MVFEPDILVTDRDGASPALVVEVKEHIIDLVEVERQLKTYMVRMRCPVGILISSEKMFLYRDRYTGYNAESVERVGEFSMAGVLDAEVPSAVRAIKAPRQRRFQMEDTVQRWLESLTTESVVAGLPPELREAVEEHVIPVLMQGEVRAAGPRWQLDQARSK